MCTPGLSQLATCWYKVGEWDAADRALGWVEAHQDGNGGFHGSYGPGASYFADVQIPWAAKFYLDAHLQRVQSFFERRGDSVDLRISSKDGRSKEVLERARPHTAILDVGCGKGRILDLLKQVYPEKKLTGIDATPNYLSYVPSGIERLSGRMEILPFRDNTFDFVFSVETLEHSLNVYAALKEMVRVTRPGGTLLVLDKDKSKWGTLECPPWEEWFMSDELVTELSKWLENVSVTPVGFDGYSPSTALMKAWMGRKR